MSREYYTSMSVTTILMLSGFAIKHCFKTNENCFLFELGNSHDVKRSLELNFLVCRFTSTFPWLYLHSPTHSRPAATLHWTGTWAWAQLLDPSCIVLLCRRRPFQEALCKHKGPARGRMLGSPLQIDKPVLKQGEAKVRYKKHCKFHQNPLKEATKNV